MELHLNEKQRNFIKNNWWILKDIFAIDYEKIKEALMNIEPGSPDDHRLRGKAEYAREWKLACESFNENREVKEEPKKLI